MWKLVIGMQVYATLFECLIWAGVVNVQTQTKYKDIYKERVSKIVTIYVFSIRVI